MIIVAVGIVIVAYLYSQYGSLPSNLFSVLASGKSLNGTAVMSIMFQKIALLPSFQDSYTGNITAGSDPTLNAYVNEENNQLVVGIAAPSAPSSFSFGTFNLSYIGSIQANKTNPVSVKSSCFYTSNQTLAQKLSLPLNKSKSSYGECQPWGNQSFTKGVANLFINISSLSNVHISSVSIGYPGISEPDPCYRVQGTGTVQASGALLGEPSVPYKPVNITFDTCLDAKYNIPEVIGIATNPPGLFSVYVWSYYTGTT
ncbi:MAG: hypothetical protein KGH64_01565 [Candidatus Micrarchaeota archaeon]|nr:hypothetical protein [Candidatus Micrarchaeota archaeon]MDE1834004.1 hypothetical protein [Candidatus Micrarchaeota archaeon]MDE1859510.1 hypothetical protein [Candidatus Micrarchaeota archaeon]